MRKSCFGSRVPPVSRSRQAVETCRFGTANPSCGGLAACAPQHTIPDPRNLSVRSISKPEWKMAAVSVFFALRFSAEAAVSAA